MLADDQGYGDMGLHGNRYVRTPRLDRLAEQSVRLEHFYVTPVCAPTRASLLTGRLAPRTGVWGVHLARDYLRLDETTLAEVFKRAGYRTAFMGKWHSGKHEPWLPWNRGFDDTWMASLYWHQNNVVSHNGQAVEWKGWTCDRLADQAAEFIMRNADRPFFLYLAYLTPHEPWDAPAQLVNRYQEQGLSRPLATVFAMIEQMDTSVGRVLDVLDQRGLATNTIVVYLSDNGPIGHCSRLGDLTPTEMALRNPAGLRGVKGNLWENGIRVPCFVRWPGRIEPRQIGDVAHATDVFPTLLDLAGVSFRPDPERPLDGITLAPLLTGEAPFLPPRRVIMPYWEARWPEHESGVLEDPSWLGFEQQNFALRTPELKWIQAWGERGLYDLNADPCETNDLIRQRGTDAEQFSQTVRDWFFRLQESKRAYQQPFFPVGKVTRRIDEVAETRNVGQVPACSAVHATGNVVVQTHWSQGWKAPGDSQTMQVDVRDAGRYRVEIEAANPTSGAVLGIDVGRRQVRGRLTERRVSALGGIVLDRGPAELTVRAESLPAGRTVFMEKLRGVRFVWLGEK